MPSPSIASLGLPRSGSSVGGALRVVGTIGGGEIGVVFLCDDEALGRRVAMKMLRPDRAVLSARVETFLSVFRATARVKSAHVVTIYDLGLHEDLPYAVMEHVPGVSLDEHRQDRGGRLGVEAALAIGIGMLRGLESLHEAGLSHGAIGPSNVLVAPDGRVVLTDPGMAQVAAGTLRPIPSAALRQRPRASTIPPRRTPLEEAKRVDVYAAAALLYGAIVGEEPRIDPRSGQIARASERADTPITLDPTLIDALTNPDSPMLVARALRSALEQVARVVGHEGDARRVLVIDSDLEQGTATAIAMENALAPVLVRRALDARRALSLAESQGFDLVILDPSVEGMSALELLSGLGDAAGTAGAPVLVLSDRASPSDVRLLLGLGATSCLYRPIDPRALGAVADALTREARRGRNRLP